MNGTIGATFYEINGLDGKADFPIETPPPTTLAEDLEGFVGYYRRALRELPELGPQGPARSEAEAQFSYDWIESNLRRLVSSGKFSALQREVLEPLRLRNSWADRPRYEESYLRVIAEILHKGAWHQGSGSELPSLWRPASLSFDVEEDFPWLSSRPLPFHLIVHELLWFLSGRCDNLDTLPKGKALWRPFAKANGDLGPIYGAQWRQWGPEKIDQLGRILEALLDPARRESRQLVMSGWNVSDLPKMALPPCHVLYHFQVRRRSLVRATPVGGLDLLKVLDSLGERDPEDSPHLDISRRLDLVMTQRSGDWLRGIPFNAASCAILLHLMCSYINYRDRSERLGLAFLRPGRVTINVANAHIYTGATLEAALQTLVRVPQGRHSIDTNISWDQTEIVGGRPMSAIRPEEIKLQQTLPAFLPQDLPGPYGKLNLGPMSVNKNSHRAQEENGEDDS